MKDIVIGSIINYTWDNIKYWVNSLDRSGFHGDKMMLCFNIDSETIEELRSRNYYILGFKSDNMDISNFNIVVDRFLWMWKFLSQCKEKYRYVISTDVKDVIFQKNPSLFLEDAFINIYSLEILEYSNKAINVSTESIKYDDEVWGKNNMFQSFGPDLYHHTKDNIIINCGVLSGRYAEITDLFLNIYLLCNGASGRYINGGGGPDQSALNIILNTKPWKDITIINPSESGWACQLGTTGPQITPEVRTKLVEQTPIIMNNKICTSKGKVYSIVHQYDRIPEWKKIIENTYKD
jgi:hypothetical protein